jgi:hypothetical protein
MIYDANGHKLGTPEIRIAPEHKDVSHKLPKRPNEEMPSFMQMSEAELMALMCGTLRLKYNPLQYRSDQRYKAKVDSVLMTGMIALMTDYLRKQGTNIETVFKEGRIEIK